VLGNGLKKQGGFVGEPAVAQDGVGGKAVGNRRTGARAVIVVIIWTGRLAVTSWILNGYERSSVMGEEPEM